MAFARSLSIEIHGLSKMLRGSQILRGIDMDLDSGTVYGLRGPNGSGKTMLMRLICGLVKPSSGELLINGEKLGHNVSFPESVGLLIENPAFISNYTALQNLQLLAAIRNVVSYSEIRSTLGSLGLDPDDRRPYRKYSLGMRQRVGLAAALMERPQLIILDEPTNGLDDEATLLLHELVRAHRAAGALVILSSHEKGELEYACDEIFEMAEGRVIGHRFTSPSTHIPRRAR